MGYTTVVKGAITITPPLTWAEISNSPFLPVNAQSNGDGRDCMYHLVEAMVETPEGLLTRKTADALVTTWEDEARAYDLQEHVQEAVTLHGEGHEFGGRIDCEGEQQGDMWRLTVVAGRVERENALIVWPSDSGATS